MGGNEKDGKTVAAGAAAKAAPDVAAGDATLGKAVTAAVAVAGAGIGAGAIAGCPSASFHTSSSWHRIVRPYSELGIS